MPINHAKLKANRESNRRGNGWRPKEGPNRIVVLAPHSRFYTDEAAELTELALKYRSHYFKMEGRPTEITLCLEETKERCPACLAWRAYKKCGDAALEQMAKDISPSDQYYMNIIDLNNLEGGIQHWPANYTCWDGVIEVATQPQWGDVVALDNAVAFSIELVPGNRTKTRRNQYKVVPERETLDMREVIDALPDWEAKLDALATQHNAPMKASEIEALLEEIGFPPIPGKSSVRAAGAAVRGGRAPAPAAPAPRRAVAPQPVAEEEYGDPTGEEGDGEPGDGEEEGDDGDDAPPPPPAPAPRRAGAPASGAAPVRAPGNGTTAPRMPVPGKRAGVPAVPAPRKPRSDAAPAVTAPRPAAGGARGASVSAPRKAGAAPSPAAAGTPHYDPGPKYENPTMAEEDIPAGAPRCFSDYDPEKHRCLQCPVVVDCQMQTLGIAD